MQDVSIVRVRKRSHNIACNLHESIFWKRPVLQLVAKRRAFDVLEHEPWTESLVLANVVQRDHVWMREVRGGAGHDAHASKQVFALFPRLKERLTQRGGTLSGGEQQMLAIGRALMSRPRLLLLDEPSLGLAPLVVKLIFGAIRELNRTSGLTVLLVEQNAYQALRLAHRGYVLVNGAITMAGSGAELLARPEIRAAYLEGSSHSA